MCLLHRINELLVNPELAIKQAKKEKSMNITFLIMLFEWVLIALGSFLMFHRLNISSVLFFLGVVGTLFVGFIVQIVFTVLGGKGSYFEGLTSLVYAILPLSASVLLSSIFILLPALGGILTLIVTSLFVVLSMAVLYRAVKELFSIDMVTALVGIGILVGGLTIALYMTFGFYAATKLPFLMSQFIPVIS